MSVFISRLHASFVFKNSRLPFLSNVFKYEAVTGGQVQTKRPIFIIVNDAVSGLIKLRHGAADGPTVIYDELLP